MSGHLELVAVPISAYLERVDILPRERSFAMLFIQAMPIILQTETTSGNTSIALGLPSPTFFTGLFSGS